MNFQVQQLKKNCDDNDIRLDTSVAKEEHVSNGNKLGIIDRLVRTLRELIEKYYDITGHRTDNIKDVMKSIIDTYNYNSHRTLDNKTPNQVFKDNDDQITRHINDSVHNQQVYKTVPFDTGDKVKKMVPCEQPVLNKHNVLNCHRISWPKLDKSFSAKLFFRVTPAAIRPENAHKKLPQLTESCCFGILSGL
jgi:hypothetical protein